MYTAVHCRTVFVNSMLYSLTQESILFCLTFHLEYNLTSFGLLLLKCCCIWRFYIILHKLKLASTKSLLMITTCSTPRQRQPDLLTHHAYGLIHTCSAWAPYS